MNHFNKAKTLIQLLEEYTDYKQFKGSLDFDTISRCIENSQLTAKELFEDAKILYENERYERALALAILSIEESKKPTFLLLFLIEDIYEGNIADFIWKAYRNHLKKSMGWMVHMMESFLDIRPLSTFSLNSDSFTSEKNDLLTNLEYSKILDKIKQRCFYSDCIDDGVPISPKDLPAEAMAGIFLTVAEDSLSEIKAEPKLLLAIKTFFEDRDFKKLEKTLIDINPDYAFLLQFFRIAILEGMNEEKCVEIFKKEFGEEKSSLINILIQTWNEDPSLLNQLFRNHKQTALG